jgi:vacuolar protein sorting-associated protein 13A/C
VRYYNTKDAEGSQYLRELEKGKYAQTDTYITHEKITAADRKSVLLVSNKRLLFIVYNQMMGIWSIDWEFSLPEITGPIPVENDTFGETFYLCIIPKEERKRKLGMFGGNMQKKVILPSRQIAKKLANKIEEARIECVNRE